MATTSTTLRHDNIKRNPGLDGFLWLLRIALGMLFIFSGVVKGNDPSGLANKMTEILEVLDLHALVPHVMLLSVLMIGFEIIAGVATIIGFSFRIFSFLLLLLNLFFTGLTAWIYFSELQGNPVVKDCGCFGDCFKISNTETFWKDVALLAAAVILFAFRKRVRPLLPKYPNTAIFVLTVFFAFGIQWYALEHNPYYDCMPFKKGTSIRSKMTPPPGIPDSTVNTYKIKNMATGEIAEYTDDNYPEDTEDTVYEMLSSDTKVIRKGVYHEPEIKGFILRDSSGQDYAPALLDNPGYSFLLFLREPMKARTDNIERLKQLYQQAQAKGVNCVVLTSGTRDETERWRAKYGIPGNYYSLDVTLSKTAMRANPGLMLIKGGVVLDKWSFRDYPATPADAGVR